MKTKSNIQTAISSKVQLAIIFMFMTSLFSNTSFGQLDGVPSDFKKVPLSVNSIFNDLSTPSELFLNFSVKTSERNALIEWSTSLENDGFLFIIECSLDLIQWESMHQTEGRADSMVQYQYSWTDQKPHKGISYYRLKIVGINGVIDYSPIKPFDFNDIVEASGLLAYPNPATTNLIVEGSTNDLENLTIINANGLDVSSSLPIVVKNSKSMNINVSELPAGFFYLKTPTNLVKIFKL